MAFKENTIATKKYKLFYRYKNDASEGQSIILVHGLGISSIYLMPVAEVLAKRYSVYLPDLPGFGKSEKPLKVLNIKEHAISLAEFMDALHLQKMILLGNSFGCQVIAEFAVLFPERVSSVIFVGPTVNPEERSVFKQGRALLADTKLEPKWQRKVANKDYMKAGVVRTLKTGWDSLSDKIEEKLPHVQSPVLVVRGTKDPFVSGNWARTVTNLLPNGRLVEIEGKGHTLNSNAPELLAREVTQFLENV
jgi:2-hydroxy-6-oxonona-2,4-dienedioate hydrolase